MYVALSLACTDYVYVDLVLELLNNLVEFNSSEPAILTKDEENDLISYKSMVIKSNAPSKITLCRAIDSIIQGTRVTKINLEEIKEKSAQNIVLIENALDMAVILKKIFPEDDEIIAEFASVSFRIYVAQSDGKKRKTNKIINMKQANEDISKLNYLPGLNGDGTVNLQNLDQLVTCYNMYKNKRENQTMQGAVLIKILTLLGE